MKFERATDPFHSKKKVYRKATTQQEMSPEKVFCRKYSCRVIRTSFENTWKTN